MTSVLVHIGDTLPSRHDVDTVHALATAVGARVHVMYTVPDPLLAGGQSEMNAAGMPELHQAIEAEARSRLRPIFGDGADTPTIQIRSGDAIRAIHDYAREAAIDVIVIGLAGEEEASLAPALLEDAPCAVLVWKRRR